MFAGIKNELNIALIYHPADKLVYSFSAFAGSSPANPDEQRAVGEEHTTAAG